VARQEFGNVSDHQASIRRQVLQRIAERRNSSPPVWKVQKEDLESLEPVRHLLSALNNPYVSTAQIEQLVDKIRVLKTRCVRRAVHSSELEHTPTLGEALGLIGNQGLETELLGVLEDLTILSAELSDQ
jgi:hypothetical protein